MNLTYVEWIKLWTSETTFCHSLPFNVISVNFSQNLKISEFSPIYFIVLFILLIFNQVKLEITFH